MDAHTFEMLKEKYIVAMETNAFDKSVNFNWTSIYRPGLIREGWRCVGCLELELKYILVCQTWWRYIVHWRFCYYIEMVARKWVFHLLVITWINFMVNTLWQFHRLFHNQATINISHFLFLLIFISLSFTFFLLLFFISS